MRPVVPDYEIELPLMALRAKRDRIYERLLFSYHSWLHAFRRDPEPEQILDSIAAQDEWALGHYRASKHDETLDASTKTEFLEFFRVCVEIGKEEHYQVNSDPRCRPHWWNWSDRNY